MDEIFRTGSPDSIWQKYCGFLSLDLKGFLEIQEHLLMQHLDVVAGSELARKLMPRKPRTLQEFRETVPLTSYPDYAPYLSEKNESVLACKPLCWARTSGHGGLSKWIPFTEEYLYVTSALVITTAMLSCASRQGDVKIQNDMRVLHNLPPVPYGVGHFANAITQHLNVNFMPALTSYDGESFEERTRNGFAQALRGGVDILSSLSSVLIRMGEHFEENSIEKRDSPGIQHPKVACRLLLAKLRSKREGRPLLPKDLWPLKGLICYGMDTNIYKEKIMYYWGKEPLQLYAATESGIMATQAWNKKDMTFTPQSSFYEFIPEKEWLKSRQNKRYRPRTVLLDEVQPGKMYEVVLTSFYGMPFLRYRIGDLVRFTDVEDPEAHIDLPQMVFESRGDDLIDISGFARLDEKTIWQAIAHTGLKYEDWCVRKEYKNGKPVVHLYIELKQEACAGDVRRLIHESLLELNCDYADFEAMLRVKPLQVTLLQPGRFQRYYQNKQAMGADLGHLKPPHMNPNDKTIQELTGVAR